MIVPIVNEETEEGAKEKLERVKRVGGRVQIDVEDGLFVDRVTAGPRDLVDYDFGSLQVEYHLMVDDPTEWIGECVEASGKKIIGQVERMGSQEYFVAEVESRGRVEAGLALEYNTPLSAIEEEMLTRVKTILLLAIPTGSSGGELKKGIYTKIRRLRERYEGTIFVDGGMTPASYRQVMAAGASEAGSSSYLFSGKLEERLKEFRT